MVFSGGKFRESVSFIIRLFANIMIFYKNHIEINNRGLMGFRWEGGRVGIRRWVMISTGNYL